jgi:hypothetical protein
MSNTPPEQNTPLRRFADSPAPWILAFGVAALVGLFAVAPKHRARQERLERMSQTREGIWYDKADAAEPASSAGQAESATAEQPPRDAENAGPSTEGAATAPSSREHLPSDDIELSVDGRAPPQHEMPPVGIFVAISLAALAAGLGLLSYLRSVSRERTPRRPRNES